MERLPPFVLAERDALIEEVYQAFKGVSREGGVSWSEAYEIDMWSPPQEEQAKRQAIARAKDLDEGWTELVADPEWFGETGLGGWSFLDPVGLRYYLPVQMVRCLQSSEDACPENLAWCLTLPTGKLRDHVLSRWSLLDARQERCVKRFVEYIGFSEGWSSMWEDAFESYWKDVAPLT